MKDKRPSVIPIVCAGAVAGVLPGDAFNVVFASLPGFGFSGKPATTGHGRLRTAGIFVELMKRLGYTR